MACHVKKVLSPQPQVKQDNDKDSVILLGKIIQQDNEITEGDDVDQPEPPRGSTRTQRQTTVFNA
eukprot:9158128-Ditylum_brightwellii.AAC.1